MANRRNHTTPRSIDDRIRTRRAMAAANPEKSRTVKSGGDTGKDVPELTADQRANLDAAKGRKQTARKRGQATEFNARRDDSPLPTLKELLTRRLAGVGKATADQALEATNLKDDDKATREQLARATGAPTEKAGLRGKALALWVLTGKSDGGQPPPVQQPTRRASSTNDAGLGSLLIEYLKANVSADANAPLQGLPTIDEDGILRVKSVHWRNWLAARDVKVGASAAVKPLREIGLEPFRWYDLPRGQRMTYAGPAPKGTGNLPRRPQGPVEGAAEKGARGRGRRASGERPFARPSDEQRELLGAVLKAFKPKGKGADAQRKVRDELIAKLDQ